MTSPGVNAGLRYYSARRARQELTDIGSAESCLLAVRRTRYDRRSSLGAKTCRPESQMVADDGHGGASRRIAPMLRSALSIALVASPSETPRAFPAVSVSGASSTSSASGSATRGRNQNRHRQGDGKLAEEPAYDVSHEEQRDQHRDRRNGQR